MNVLVINPGATSTKVAVYCEDQELFRETVEHEPAELGAFKHIVEQKDFRRKSILDVLKRHDVAVSGMDAVCGRGGLLRHIPSGTYRVTEQVLADVVNPPYGEHASNLGVVLAKEIADMAGLPAFFVDPVSVDELQDIARVSGFCGMERESFFHALNQKSVARKAAQELGRPYESLDLIVVHMGGGVSVAAHHNGRVIDMFNVKDDGSFALDRGGSLPVNAVINFCFSGKSKAEVKRILGSEAGVYSYLHTRDFRAVERMAATGDKQAVRVYEALAYQHAKDIGALAAVLHFHVDAIVYTGGIAYSERFCARITHYVGGLAPILRFPGEEEMRSLAEGALRVLHGAKALDYEGEAHGKNDER